MTYTRTAETVEIDGTVYPTVLDEDRRLRVVEECWKCSGTGRYMGPPEPGACFACNGVGAFYPLLSSVKGRATAARRAAAKAEEKAAAARAEREAREADALRWISDHSELLGRISKHQRAGRVLDAILDSVAAIEIPSEADVARAVEILAELDSRGEVPVGRVVLVGEVVGRKTVEGDYGPTTKITIRLENGARVFGTEPSSIDVRRGDLVRLTATVEASRDDASFGFYKRPTKAEVVGRAADPRSTAATLQAAADSGEEVELVALVEFAGTERLGTGSRTPRFFVRVAEGAVLTATPPQNFYRSGSHVPEKGDVVRFLARVTREERPEADFPVFHASSIRGIRRV